MMYMMYFSKQANQELTLRHGLLKFVAFLTDYTHYYYYVWLIHVTDLRITRNMSDPIHKVHMNELP